MKTMFLVIAMITHASAAPPSPTPIDPPAIAQDQAIQQTPTLIDPAITHAFPEANESKVEPTAVENKLAQPARKSRAGLVEPLLILPSTQEIIRTKTRTILLPAFRRWEIVPARPKQDGPIASVKCEAQTCRSKAVITRTSDATYVSGDGQTHHEHKGEHRHKGPRGHRLRHTEASHTTTTASGVTTSNATATTTAH